MQVAAFANRATVVSEQPRERLRSTGGTQNHPYDEFVAGQQNDVPLLLGSNADEARAMINVSGVTAAAFESDIAQSFGSLPPALMAAYTHTTDEEARTARLDFERDLRFGWDMWAWARLHATTGHSPVYYYSFQHRPPFPKESVYASLGASNFASCGMSSTISISTLGPGSRQIGWWQKRCPLIGSTLQGRAIRMALAFQRGLHSRIQKAGFKS
jgi:hypothetical protein